MITPLQKRMFFVGLVAHAIAYCIGFNLEVFGAESLTIASYIAGAICISIEIWLQKPPKSSRSWKLGIHCTSRAIAVNVLAYLVVSWVIAFFYFKESEGWSIVGALIVTDGAMILFAVSLLVATLTRKSIQNIAVSKTDSD